MAASRPSASVTAAWTMRRAPWPLSWSSGSVRQGISFGVSAAATTVRTPLRAPSLCKDFW